MSTNAYMPFDNTASDCATLAISTTYRSAGNIKYRLSWDSYREEYEYDGGSYQQIQAACLWAEANDFVDFSLGYTVWDTTNATRFNRILPMASPYQSNMYASSATLNRFGMNQGQTKNLSSTNYWPTADFAFYDLTFRPRKYALLSDADVDGSSYPWAAYGCKELGRYVERIVRYQAQELKIGNYQIESYTPSGGTLGVGTAISAIQDVGFTPAYSAEVVYIWRQVPLLAVPLPAIATCSLCVHSTTGTSYAAFDKGIRSAGTWVDTWAPETLMFKGLGQELDPYVGPGGELLVDVHYLFGYQPKGWNHFSNATGGLQAIRRTGTTSLLYGLADFRTLFQPTTA